jgi:hypothetical protein
MPGNLDSQAERSDVFRQLAASRSGTTRVTFTHLRLPLETVAVHMFALFRLLEGGGG